MAQRTPITPRKINMEPENISLEKEIIFQNIIFRFYVNLRGVAFVYHGLSNKSPAKLGVASGDRHRSFYYDQIFDCPSCHNHGSAEKWVYLQLLVSFHLVGNFPLNHDYGRKATGYPPRPLGEHVAGRLPPCQ